MADNRTDKQKYEDNIIELKKDKVELKTKIDKWEKDKPNIDHPKYELWSTTYNNLLNEMKGLDDRLKGLEDTLGKLSIQQPISNGMYL